MTVINIVANHEYSNWWNCTLQRDFRSGEGRIVHFFWCVSPSRLSLVALAKFGNQNYTSEVYIATGVLSCAYPCDDEEFGRKFAMNIIISLQ